MEVTPGVRSPSLLHCTEPASAACDQKSVDLLADWLAGWLATRDRRQATCKKQPTARGLPLDFILSIRGVSEWRVCQKISMVHLNASLNPNINPIVKFRS